MALEVGDGHPDGPPEHGLDAVDVLGTRHKVTRLDGCLRLRGVGVGDPHRFSFNRSCGRRVGGVPCTSDQPVS